MASILGSHLSFKRDMFDSIENQILSIKFEMTFSPKAIGMDIKIQFLYWPF
jgi:hypothetical protein